MVGHVKPELFVCRWCIALASMFFVLGAADVSLAAEGETESGAEADESSKKEAADEDDGTKDAEDDGDGQETPNDEAFGHQGQFGLRIGVVGGYRMVLRYDESPYCRTPNPLKAANDQPKFCGHTAPFALTAGLSFALFDFLEPFAWARFGLEPEPETDTEPVVMFGLGTRIYTMSDSPFKIFIEPAIGLEIEKGRGTPLWQANSPEYTEDIVLHLAAGPSFDFSRYVGAYLTGGITTGIVRALHNSLDVELGLQGRYP
jgi:opacity protein-like surface antigen